VTTALIAATLKFNVIHIPCKGLFGPTNRAINKKSLGDPPWHNHQPDSTGIFRLNWDDKNWHTGLSAMEGKLVQNCRKYLLCSILNTFSNV
jgi:hypothetical protein